MTNTSQLLECCTGDNVKDERTINCIKCNKSFHLACMSLTDTADLNDLTAKWICTTCTTGGVTKATKSADYTPNRNVSMNRGSKRPALNSPPSQTSVTADEVRIIVKEVIKSELSDALKQLNDTLITTINKHLEPIKVQMKEINESMTFMNERFEDLENEHAVSRKTMKDVQDDNLRLKNTVTDLNMRINYLEQQARANNLEVQCVPENKNENLYATIMKLVSTVGADITKSDILHCTRIAKITPNSSRPRSIIVQLASPRIRDEFLASVINYNKRNPQDKLNSAHLGLSTEKSPIYVVEHLSVANKALHASARLKAKKLGYKYVWTRNGRIFVRKTDDAEFILINNTDSLNKIV